MIVEILDRIIPHGKPLGHVQIICKIKNGKRITRTFFEDQIENLPGNSRYNITPGMEMEIKGKKARIITS